MSDFLLSTRAAGPGILQSHLKRFLGPVTSRESEYHGAWGSLAVIERADENVVREDARFLTVVIGDPVVCVSGEPPALSGLDGRREQLHRLLTSGPFDAGTLLDGHFAVLIIDKENGALRIITDRFSFVPVFRGQGFYGTHADVVARAAGLSNAIDLVSVTDALMHLAITYPWTAYQGIDQLAPGTVHGPGRESYTYWQPRERAEHADLEGAARALEGAIARSVANVCHGQDTVGLLLSGGEDSRVVLGAVPDGVEVRSFIFADWHSREVRTARSAARSHGSDLLVGLRDPHHYARGFRETAAMIGSGHLFTDVHGFGLHRSLGLVDLPIVLGGLSADSLLKAVYAGHRGQVPSAGGWDPAPLRPELVAEARARRQSFRDTLRELRPESADEWAVLWPFSMRKHGANVDGNRRLFPSYEVYHARGVLEVAASAPQSWKQNRRLFLRAARPLLHRVRLVPHASDLRFPGLHPAASLALAAPLWIARVSRALLTGQLRRRHRPWPRWSAVLRSPALQEGFAAFAPERSPIAPVFDWSNPERIRQATEHWYSLRQVALLQLSYVSTLAAE